MKGIRKGRNFLHPRFLDLKAGFLTCHEGIRRQLRRLPQDLDRADFKHILVSGPKGGGKATLAIQAWRKVVSSRQLVFAVPCEFLNGEKDFFKCLRNAEGSVLLLKNIEKLPSTTRDELPAMMARVADVVVFATVDFRCHARMDLASFGQFLTIPPLEDRPEDIQLIVSTLLARRGDYSCTAEAMRVFQSSKWPGEFSQLANCVMKSLWAARADGRCILEQSDVYAGMNGNFDLDFLFLDQFLGSSFRYQIEQQGLRGFLNELEAVIIASGLVESCGNLTKTARKFRVPINTLASRCKTLGPLVSEVRNLLVCQRS